MNDTAQVLREIFGALTERKRESDERANHTTGNNFAYRFRGEANAYNEARKIVRAKLRELEKHSDNVEPA